MSKIKLTQDQAMELALKEAQKGLGFVSPNPPVGAVILDSEGYLISKGYHQAYGKDHAEIMALQNCSSSLKGATLYVTLEPCSHQGMTPSCAEKLITLPFRKICVGMIDPNPIVCGKGIKKIQQSSIEVEIYEGHLKSKIHELIEIFSFNMKYQKPFIGVKIASSLNNCITSSERWITNEKSRKQVSYLRGHYDAVCVGSQTVLLDNPRLNARHPQFEDQENNVIILDPLGECQSFLSESNLMKVRDISKITVVTSPSFYKNYKGEVLLVPTHSDNLFDLEDVSKRLFQKGIRSILVEGGGKTFSSFLSISQRLYLFIAPIFIDPKDNIRWHSSSISSLREARCTMYENDTLITGLLE